MRFFGRKGRKGERGEILPEANEGLPDSHRLNGLCSRCGKQSSFALAGSLPVTYEYDGYTQDHSGSISHQEIDRVISLIYRNCEHGVVVVEEMWVGDHPRREGIHSGGTIPGGGFIGGLCPTPSSAMTSPATFLARSPRLQRLYRRTARGPRQ